jgi:hypothetical protein
MFYKNRECPFALGMAGIPSSQLVVGRSFMCLCLRSRWNRLKPAGHGVGEPQERHTPGIDIWPI